MKGEEPIIYIDSEKHKEEHDHLLDIKIGKIAVEDFEKEADQLIAEIEKQRPFHNVPTIEQNNGLNLMNEWLTQVRLKNMNK